MTRPEVERLTAWLLEKAAGIPYGEISLKITLHAGQIRQIEKMVTVKERPGNKEKCLIEVTQ